MIALKLILFAVLFIIIDCREFGRFVGRGNVRHRQPVEEYNYNHPPASENYEAIPVAVVYEDEGSRKDKSVISDIPETSKVQQVNRGALRSKPNATIKPNVTREESINSVDLNLNKAEIKEENKLKPIEQVTAEAKKEHQIPVAVVYEPESPYYKQARSTGQRIVTKRRKVQRPAAEERKVAPAAEERRVAPAAEEKQTASEVEEKRTAGAANIKRVDPVTEQEQFAPAVEEERVDLAAEIKQGGLSEEKKVVTPVAEKRRVVSAVQEKRVVVKEAINVDNQQNAYEVTSTQKIRGNSDNKQTQQFPKRDSSTVRRKDVVPIVQSENLVFSHSGDFQYSYEGGDGTKAFEKGQLKTYQDDNAGEAVSGGFSYTAKDGNEYSLTYTADENGYRPMGAHLPTPPPIPPAIARALAYLATKTTPEPVTVSIKESDSDY